MTQLPGLRRPSSRPGAPRDLRRPAARVAVALTAAALTLPSTAAAFPKRVVATKGHGIRSVAGMRIGTELFAPGAVPTLADVRARLGRERHYVEHGTSNCSGRWPGGLRLDFVSFGVQDDCSAVYLQSAQLTGPGWRVAVGTKRYRIGTSRSRIPRGAKRWPQGYALATMPFVGQSGTPTVMAHLSRGGHIDRFTLFIGGGGD